MPSALFLVAKKERMINTLFGIKIESTRKFSQDGFQVPVTKVLTMPMLVVQIKTEAKDGYNGIQLGIGEKKFNRLTKPLKGHLKKADLKKGLLYLREVKVDDPTGFKLGEAISSDQIFRSGDLVNISGFSRGKGFTGVVKRWGFAGGPRTHGQSDRERAPGSIGQTTTIGRVFKGKKMAGRAGGERKTVKNLQILEIDQADNLILVKGLTPGVRGSLLEIKKAGELKKPIRLIKEEDIIIGPGEKGSKPAKREKEKKVSQKDKEAKDQKAKPDSGQEENAQN